MPKAVGTACPHCGGVLEFKAECGGGAVTCGQCARTFEAPQAPQAPDATSWAASAKATEEPRADESGVVGFVALCVLGAGVAYALTVGLVPADAKAFRATAPYCEWLLGALCVIAVLGFAMVANRLSALREELRKSNEEKRSN